MASQPKQFHSGHWYHVYARSQDEVRLFEDDDEREWFINRLDSIFKRRDVGLGSLCLMDTHYHALARMGDARLDRALNGLHMSYAKYVNSRRDRDGSLFRKHPGTDIILNDKYLLQVVPYIHKNPVQAGMVDDPRQYDWHTDELYREGEWKHGSLDSWLWPPGFEENPRRVYRERMGEEIDVSERSEGYIGTEEEWDKLEKRDPDRKNRSPDRRERKTKKMITNEVLKGSDVTLKELKERGKSQPEADLRHVVMVKLYEEGYGPTEIAEYFNRTKGSVMYAIRKRSEDEDK